ncbi:hypothetical protein QFC19_003660 [Naganishia cerealis]|uniref:Uncharacterized protein n=1 Tax=Naganishia cerealis TaxID=610337 RepID=A0ACC2W1D5_9TREE|nr:hypothetical protein QFC19_003660 [Naganishia cerealis]
MPLKRLELCDFKSYRGEQVIDFGPSYFTCIIGPNGSGKSNLMDAISFVLGVKSNQLRSNILKDLIYRGREAAQGQEGDLGGGGDGNGGGTGARKPKATKKKDAKEAKTRKRKQREDDPDASDEDEEMDDDDGDDDGEEEEEGADEDEESEEEEREAGATRTGENDAKTAWVMAVYEDADAKEFKYKRSINSKGTSTYSLNGRTVTHTTYNQSLEKHNILVKAKNFLVFQGDVEAVAQQNPKELSRLIDQISGSLDYAEEYNTAKATQERITETATLNYSKKRGITSEARHYREQKEEVTRWETLREEREELIVQHTLWRLFHIKGEIDVCQAKIDEAEDRMKGLKRDQTAQERKTQAAKQAQAKAALELKKHQAEIKQAERALEEKKPNLLTIETQIEHSKKKISTSEKLIKDVERDEARQDTTVRNLQKDLDDTRKASDAATERQREAARRKGTALSADDLDEYRKLKASASSQAVEERKELEARKRELKKLRDTLNTAKENLAATETQQSKLQDEVSILQERQTSLEAQAEDARRNMQQKRTDLDQIQRDVSRINRLETEANERLQEALNQLLAAGVHKRENDSKAKLRETVSSLKRIFPGVHGRLADLCQPTENRFQIAIGTVLGRNNDAIVVDMEETGIACIEYMRNQRAGQATFIPLDTIQVKPINDKLRSLGLGSRLAIDVIKYDPTLERAFQHACGSALVCDTMDIAKDRAYNKGVQVKTVTLQGSILHKSGLITGGQVPRQDRETFAEQDIQALQKTRDAMLNQLSEHAKRKPKASDIARLENELREAEANHRVLSDQLTAANQRLDSARRELNHANESIGRQRKDVNKAQDAVNNQNAKVEELASQVNAVDDGIFVDFCRRIRVANIREYENEQLKVAQEQNDALLKFRSQIARLEHQLKFETAQLDGTRERLQRLRATVERERQNLDEKLQADLANLQNEIEEAEGEIEELHSRLEDFESDLNDKNAAFDAARKALNRATRALDEVSKDVSGWKDEIESLSSERYSIYRKCRLEDINIPLTKRSRGTLKDVPITEDKDDNDMDVDEGETPLRLRDFDIEVDFDDLEEEERTNGNPEHGQDIEERIANIAAEIEKMAPNLKSRQKLNDVEARLREVEREGGDIREQTKAARDAFLAVKKRRCDLFNKAFNHIAERIDEVYKELTKGKASPIGGVAYLSLEDSEEPYLSGIKYHAMPPMKRFRDMDQLSGGEKTMAALALLFAIHSYQPSPFFVLDEVDAALDNTNVGRIANYIRQHSSAAFQFIVISLKNSLFVSLSQLLQLRFTECTKRLSLYCSYEQSDCLVGVHRNQDVNSSKTLTLDLRQYAE